MRSSISGRACYRGAAYPGLLLAPSLLLAQLAAAYGLASGRCTPGGGIALHAVFAGSFAMALAITIHAALASRREHGSPERQRFFAALAPVMGALVCLVIAAQWVAAAILPACG